MKLWYGVVGRQLALGNKAKDRSFSLWRRSE